MPKSGCARFPRLARQRAAGRENGSVTDRRSADDLRAAAHQAWPEIESLIAAAEVPVRVVQADARRRDAALAALQLTTASFLGAVVAECGGLLIDHGWLRMLGAGAGGLPGVHEANTITGSAPEMLVIGWDVLGGRFAVNGGGLDAAPGDVCYWAPDTLQWTGLGGGYSAFLAWSLSTGLTDFYSTLRWPGWQAEVDSLPADQGLSLFPPPSPPKAATSAWSVAVRYLSPSCMLSTSTWHTNSRTCPRKQNSA